MNISQALPNSDAVLQLEPEELAPYLLQYLAANMSVNSGAFHLNNLLNTGYGNNFLKPYDNDERVANAFREAWSWLVREGLLVERDHGWHILSRRGQQLAAKRDFGVLRKSSLLPKAALHPQLADRVWPTFTRGEYEPAVMLAFREVEIAVRTAADLPAADIGTILMEKAFKANVGPLTDTTVQESEQLAMMRLFAGAFGLFRNTTMHRHTNLTDHSEAAEMISLASLLMRIVDARVAARSHHK